MSDDLPKLTKLVPLRLSDESNLRVMAAARRRGIKRPEWIRQAIMAELTRDEAAAAQAILTPEQAALLELCAAVQQRGVDPKTALTAALEQKLADDVFICTALPAAEPAA